MPTALNLQHLAKVQNRILTAPMAEPMGRLLSWKHCYDFFYANKAHLIAVHDHAALHLGFYLASWGMLRGSSQLITKNHHFYREIVAIIAGFPILTLHKAAELKFGHGYTAAASAEQIAEVATQISGYLRAGGVTPTATLVSKILLGTTACVPAFDTEARKGLHRLGLRAPNEPLMDVDYLTELLTYADGNRIAILSGMPANYPPLHVFDLYLWS